MNGRALAREPLLHFLVLGALLFAIWPTEAPDTVVITETKVNTWLAAYERQHGRAPSPAERAQLLERQVAEDLLYREALALGFDREDTVIRGRLIEKIRYLLQHSAPRSEPTDAELTAQLRGHAERYGKPAVLSFEQVFVRRDGDALGALAELQSGRAPETVGDAFPHPRSLRQATSSQVDSRYGAGFFAIVAAVPVGGWAGPVESSFGQHLVRVSGYTPGRSARLEEVRGRLRSDVLLARRAQAEAAGIERLRAKYSLTWEATP